MLEKKRWLSEVLGVRFPRPAAGDPAAAAVMDLMDSVMADLPALRQRDADLAARIETVLATARAELGGGAADRALRLLDGASKAIANSAAQARARDVAAAMPEGTVGRAVDGLEAARRRWATARLRSIDGLNALTGVLRQQEDPDLHDIADRIDGIVTRLPDALDNALAALAATMAAAGSDPAPLRRRVEALLSTASALLHDDATALAACEANPWGIAVALRVPLADAIADVQDALRAI
ncbi:hypothetical protein [Roseomonas marmotae]|uniref:Uncharacterized protein n=1 Tax=Roseomonas marmotae TaxID=2768161 RepID=A0ABS3K8C7_9PROT|nr:hypothetical protein [Roseomonas marmotae]MBO1073724.1 hypothetical protein [Roseomonas marmotae]QTI78641.1 hypothetical protein IAI58_13325 [Roseomonas marmotae]